jgi:hypothetical protein
LRQVNPDHPSAMLTEDQRLQIKLEEQFRAEVRAELERARPARRPNAAWAFLNSAFALWLFSAVFITGAGSELARRQSKKAEESRTRELIERLDLEASYRFSQVLGRLDRLHEASGATQAALDSTLEVLVRHRAQDVPPLYPDFLR